MGGRTKTKNTKKITVSSSAAERDKTREENEEREMK